MKDGDVLTEVRNTSREKESDRRQGREDAVEVAKETLTRHAVVDPAEDPRLDLAVGRLMTVGAAVRELVGARTRRIARANMQLEPGHARSVPERVLAGALLEAVQVRNLGRLVEVRGVLARVAQDEAVVRLVGRREDLPDAVQVGHRPDEGLVEEPLGSIDPGDHVGAEVVPRLRPALVDEVGLKNAVDGHDPDVTVTAPRGKGPVAEQVFVCPRSARELDERLFEDVRPPCLRREAAATEVAPYIAAESPILQERVGQEPHHMIPTTPLDLDPAAGAAGGNLREPIHPLEDPEGREPRGLSDRLVDHPLEPLHERLVFGLRPQIPLERRSARVRRRTDDHRTRSRSFARTIGTVARHSDDGCEREKP